MKNGLNINKFMFFEIDINIGAQKFFGQQRNIKTVGIESSKIVTFYKFRQSFCYFFKSGCIFYILIVYTVNQRCLQWDGHFRIYAQLFFFFCSVNMDFYKSNFYDSVSNNIYSRCFQIEKNYWIF